MNNYLFLLIASVVVFFIIFSISFWLFSADKGTALGIAAGGSVSGLIVELIQGHYEKNRKEREMRRLERRE